jgi:hypothetical protein
MRGHIAMLGASARQLLAPIQNIRPSRTGIFEAAERLNTAQKCEGATGSLAIVVSGHGPSHPRSLQHGSRLPAMSRRGAASSDCDRGNAKASGWFPRPAGLPTNGEGSRPDWTNQSGLSFVI